MDEDAVPTILAALAKLIALRTGRPGIILDARYALMATPALAWSFGRPEGRTTTLELPLNEKYPDDVVVI